MKAIVLLAVLTTASAQAAVITQSASFPINITVNQASDLTVIDAATGKYQVEPASYFQTQLTPFDTSLGTLTGVTISWDLSGTLTATTGAAGGGASISFGGDIIVDGSAVGGGGGGGGNGGPPNFTFSADFPGAGTTHPYVVDLDASSPVWSSFTGTAPISLEWDNPVVFQGNADMTNVSIVATGGSVVTYTYTAVPEPASALLALGSGLLAFRRRRAVI